MILEVDIEISCVTKGFGTLRALELFLLMEEHVFWHILSDHFSANLARSHFCPQMETLHVSLEMSLTLKRLATNLAQSRLQVGKLHVLAEESKNSLFFELAYFP